MSAISPYWWCLFVIAWSALFACAQTVEIVPSDLDEDALQESEKVVLVALLAVTKETSTKEATLVSSGYDPNMKSWKQVPKGVLTQLRDGNRRFFSLGGLAKGKYEELPIVLECDWKERKSIIEFRTIYFATIRTLNESLGEAEVLVGRYSGPQNASGAKLTMKRIEGEWHVIKKSNEWVS